MSLLFPRDLDAWHRWHTSQNLVRRLRDLARKPAPVQGWIGRRGDSPRVLAVIDATTPTQLASIVRPLSLLGPEVPAALVAPEVIDDLPGVWNWERFEGALPQWAQPEVLLSVGHYLPLAALATERAVSVKARNLIVQHGLLTPHAPPLPEGAHLLAFSEADAAFAASGRSDVTSTVVGSQLLWAAATPPPESLLSDEPIYLGQLHGAELPRRAKVRAVNELRAKTSFSYRPHPAERDRLSRWQHSRWQRAGLQFEQSGKSLAELRRPVISIFSTGVLESAVSGLPAWVDFPNPPKWLEEFWDRYGLARWGGDPTPAPAKADIEPARAIAAALIG